MPIRTNTSCSIGYIYCLYYKGRPFYIGQSVVPKKRYWQHKNNAFVRNKAKDVYAFIRSITTFEMYDDDVAMKVIKCCKESDLRYYEVQAIKRCLKAILKIYNACCISNTLRLTLLGEC